jgi:fluoride ion exporter CrcB/FEX
VAGLGVAVKIDGETICSVTAMSLSALGAFNRWIVVVLVDASAKPPQPEAAATVNVTALVVAVPLL